MLCHWIWIWSYSKTVPFHMIYLIYALVFSCPSMDWGPRSQPYPPGTYVRYLSHDFVNATETPGNYAPPPIAGNNDYWIGTYCSEPSIPNDSIPSDTTDTDTAQVDSTGSDTLLVKAINRNTDTMMNLSILFSMIVGMVLMLMGYRDGKRG